MPKEDDTNHAYNTIKSQPPWHQAGNDKGGIHPWEQQ